MPEEVAMRIVACGLIAGAALLGAAPIAMADDVSHEAGVSAESQAVPRDEVSVLAVSLTVGGAIATAGSGVVLVLTRRRKPS
ncbi:MAG: hypothetical protein ACRDS1_01230 [Pseudonocardiaceae bacterium]